MFISAYVLLQRMAGVVVHSGNMHCVITGHCPTSTFGVLVYASTLATGLIDFVDRFVSWATDDDVDYRFS